MDDSKPKKKRKKKAGRKPLRVKIRGNPLPLIDKMLGKESGDKDGSLPPKN